MGVDEVAGGPFAFWLTVGGLLLQIIGLAVAVLALERRVPLTKLRAALRRVANYTVLGSVPRAGRTVLGVASSMLASVSASARALVKPGPKATLQRRVEILEQGHDSLHIEVGEIGRQLRGLPDKLDKRTDAKLKPIRDELHHLDQRIEAVQSSDLGLAWLGLLLTGAGVSMTLLGYLLSTVW